MEEKQPLISLAINYNLPISEARDHDVQCHKHH